MDALLVVPRGGGYVVRLNPDYQRVSGHIVEQEAVIEEAGVHIQVVNLVAVEKLGELLAHALLVRFRAVGDVYERHAPVEFFASGHGGQCFVRGYAADGVHHLDGALAGRVEQADAVNLVAPEFYAGGQFGADRKYVYYAAAPAGEAGRIDRGLEAVAHSPPGFERVVQVNHVAHFEGVDGGLERIAV